MPKQLILPEGGPKPGGAYSPGIRAGDFIFVAGQGPSNPATGKIEAEEIEGQTRQVLENVKAILAAGGASMADVVKATVHLSDMSLFARYNVVYAEYFPDPKPVRTTVGSQLHGFLVEIDVVAYVGA
jgi:2-iminobutanoate/2-iminopropanoate deaminase